ncbi:MAG: hypothetical protein GY811_29600 [Myxococcales bacterium]|nr:hypothetical protein [Myxococcales bacterium]
MISDPILLTTAVLACLGFAADAQADSHLTETSEADSATFASESNAATAWPTILVSTPLGS